LKLFLSYSTNDKRLANKIYRWLRRQGLTVWIDRVEMKPGEKLLPKIEKAIKKADFLVVIITKNSNRSSWVKKEIKFSIARELTKKKFTILPIVLNNSTIPPSLEDRLWIRIDSNISGIDKIISSIFPEKFILEIRRKDNPCVIDKEKLVEQLDEFFDLSKNRIHVWMHDNLINNINDAAKKILSYLKKGKIKSTVPTEIEDKYIYLYNSLSFYNVNLSILLSNLIENIHKNYTNRADFISTAIESVANCVKFFNYSLVGYLHSIMSLSNAEEVGYPDVKALLSEYEGYYKVTLGSNEELFIRNFFHLLDEELSLIEVTGNRDEKIQYGRFYLWSIDNYDRVEIAHVTEPRKIISDYKWYIDCIPQILSGHLWSNSFRYQRMINELEYRIVYGLDEYSKMGFA
jgi:TIR domain-containing protein